MHTGERILRARSRIVISALVASAAIACSPLSPALAADITPAVTVSKTAVSGTYNENEQIRVTIDWSVSSAAAGDTFTAPLDKALDPRKFVPFQLKDTDGAVVATVAVKRDSSGDPIRDVNGDAILEFTFTSFADSHTNLHGQAWFDIGFDLSVVTFPDGTTSVDRTIYGSLVTITKSKGPVGNEHLKYGNWRSPHNSEAEATALNPDGTSANPGADIRWSIQLQGGPLSQAPGWTQVTVVDTAGPGQHFECPLSPAPSFIVYDGSIQDWTSPGGTGPQVVSTDCQPDKVTLVIAKDSSDEKIYRLRIPTWISGSPLPSAFSNSATLSYQFPESTLEYGVEGAIARSASGGSGDGSIVLAPPPPKLTIAKTALASKATAGTNTRWRITVRNTGAGAATNVRICDVPLDKQSFPTATVTYTVGSVTKTGKFKFSSGQACLTIPTLAVGQRVRVIVRTHLPTTATGRVRNRASATAAGIGTVRATARVPVVAAVSAPVPSVTG